MQHALRFPRFANEEYLFDENIVDTMQLKWLDGFRLECVKRICVNY